MFKVEFFPSLVHYNIDTSFTTKLQEALETGLSQFYNLSSYLNLFSLYLLHLVINSVNWRVHTFMTVTYHSSSTILVQNFQT
jgi:hypothetical protein